jgi:septum formation topological specificity factor MinE
MGIESQIEENEELFKQAREELPAFVDAFVEIKGKQLAVSVCKENVLRTIDINIQDLKCALTARKADLISVVGELKNK